jgi:hypothetical protein
MDAQQAAEIREIVKAVIEEERKQREGDEFYIKRKSLYDTHQRAVSFFEMVDSIGSVIGRTIVYAVLVGLASVAIWVLGRMR